MFILQGCVALFAQNLIQLQQFSSGFTRISSIDHAGDSRLFVEEQKGKIWILDSLGVKQTTPFLDIQSKVKSSGNEQGLLGLAFHPNYKNNGYFYINYTNLSGHTVVARYTVTVADSNVADANSELILMTVNQPYSNHNGGDIHFGPDGYLYIGLGDGGSQGDPGNRSQNMLERLGKMLRIDVDNPSLGSNYGIPPTNPYVALSSVLPEIWAAGLRNPWRFSFDPLTGDMWIGDVGQNNREEVDFQPANSTGGENYGWRCYEGTVAYNTTGCQPLNTYVPPVYEYPHTGGSCSLTGGVVYRGSVFPNLYGMYICCDYCSGKFWAIKPAPGGGFTSLFLGTKTLYVYGTFAYDYKGEIYVGGNGDGKVYKLIPTCELAATFANVTDVTCAGDSTGSISLNVTGAANTATYAWSNGSTASTLSNVPAGSYSVTITDEFNCTQTLSATIDEPTSLALAPLICPFEAGDTLNTLASGGTTPYTYLWSNGSTQPFFVPTNSGTYSLVLTDANGCVYTDSIACVLSDIAHPQMHIEKWSIAPNPTANSLFVNIQWLAPTTGTVSVYDGLAKKVYENSFISQSHTQMEIPENALAPGLYLIEVRTAKGKISQKFVKE